MQRKRWATSLFTVNGLGYMRDEMQLGVYETGVKVFLGFEASVYIFPDPMAWGSVDVEIAVFCQIRLRV